MFLGENTEDLEKLKSELDKLNKTTAQAEQECRVIMDRYSRSEHYKPNSIFGDMAGK